jgi:cytochrome c5
MTRANCREVAATLANALQVISDHSTRQVSATAVNAVRAQIAAARDDASRLGNAFVRLCEVVHGQRTLTIPFLGAAEEASNAGRDVAWDLLDTLAAWCACDVLPRRGEN